MVSSNKYLGKVQGKWVDKIPCTSCTSSDALVVYEKDGKHDATCFSCGHYEPNPPGYGDNQTFLTERSDEKELGSTVEGHRLGVSQHPPSTDQQVIEDFKTYPIRALPERGITQRICEKYGVRVSLSPQDGESTVTHKYPYYKDDKLTGYKERICATKAMWSKGDCTGAALFGSHCHKPNGKTLFITEGECFPDYAEILTPDGWVTFKEYSGQSVAQYTEAGSLRFVAPSAVIKKPYKGDLVKHSVKGYTSITTPDHNLVSMDYLGRLKKHKAKDTPPRINTVPRVGVLKSVTNTGLTEDQIALTLAVCADAKIDVRKTKNNYAHFGFVKERKVSRLKGILDRLSLAYVENISDKHTYISFTLPDFIKGKELPPSWISTSTQEERLFIIDELVHWDGNSVPNRNQVEFSSKHYEEAKWVQTIAHVSGFCSSIIERSNDLGTWYKVSVLFGKKHSSWQSMKTETIPYDGNVHCVTVPTGMIMVRINDHISISGNCDALALYQVLTSLSTLDHYDPAVVSLSHGSASAAKDISQDYDYVNSFDKIVLCFDMDEAGQRAVDDACKILAGKVYVAKYSEKDANDMLLKGKAEELKWDVLKHAKQYMPDNIVNYNDCWDRYKNARNQQCYPFPDGWPQLNEKTYGVRLGELVMITSGSGMGKTQWMRELKDHYHRTTDFKFGDIALEEDVGDSMAGMMSLYLNKRITLPDVEVTDEEEQEAFNFYFKDNRWTGYDYFGGLDDDNLFSKIRFLAATGHKFIYLDHLSIIVSEYAAEGGERERIDTIMTKLAKMVKELNITIFLIVHLKKTSGTTSFEEGATPSLDDLRGSGTLKQLSMTVIALSRNQQHENSMCANTSKVTVLKCRFTGRTGTADYLYFNQNTGRMVPVSKPEGYEATKGGNKDGGYRQQAF